MTRKRLLIGGILGAVILAVGVAGLALAGGGDSSQPPRSDDLRADAPAAGTDTTAGGGDSAVVTDPAPLAPAGSPSGVPSVAPSPTPGGPQVARIAPAFDLPATVQQGNASPADDPNSSSLTLPPGVMPIAPKEVPVQEPRQQADRVPVDPAPDAPVSGPQVRPVPPIVDPVKPGTTPPAPVSPGIIQPGADRQNVPAPIDGLDIVVRESFPPQYTLRIQAGLPSGCAQRAGYEMAQSGTTVRVAVMNSMPTGQAICTMIYGMYELNLDLTGTLESGKTYTIQVNDKSLTYKAQ